LRSALKLAVVLCVGAGVAGAEERPFAAAYEDWRGAVHQLQPADRAEVRRLLERRNQELFDRVRRDPAFENAVVLRNGVLILRSRMGDALEFADGLVDYTPRLFFVAASEMKRISAAGARLDGYFAAVVGRKVPVTAPKPGTYGLRLKGAGPLELEVSAHAILVRTRRGLDDRVGVMVNDRPEDEVVQVIPRSDDAALTQHFRENAPP
jgi:hypothetical protein